jgi:CRP-like cAMP-binding protein
MINFGGNILKQYIESIKNCSLFKDLNENEILEITKKSKILTFEKDEIIKQRNDPIDEILILIEGEALGLFVNEEGRVIQIDHMIAPKTLAIATIFASNPKYPVDVVAIKKCKILTLSKDILIHEMMKNEKILKNYLQNVSDTFIFITDRFYEITLKNLIQKVCSYLYDSFKKQNSKTIKLEMSKTELAREFGVTRPALSRVFIELEKKGIIEMEGKNVKIKDLRYIEDYATYF